MKEYKTALPEITLKYKSGEQRKIKVSSSQDSNEAFRLVMNQDTLELNEEAVAFFLNRQNNTIGWWRISTGGISGTVIDVRLLMAAAIKCAASGILIAHNHPSGNLKPSLSDREITKKIKSACGVFDISLIDHLIIAADDKFYSFADEGEL